MIYWLWLFAYFQYFKYISIFFLYKTELYLKIIFFIFIFYFPLRFEYVLNEFDWKSIHVLMLCYVSRYIHFDISEIY